MPYTINTTTKRPNDFQRKQAERYLNLETELFTVRRITRESGSEEVSSSEWYLIAAVNEADAIACAEAETARHYGGDWTHEHTIEK